MPLYVPRPYAATQSIINVQKNTILRIAPLKPPAIASFNQRALPTELAVPAVFYGKIDTSVRTKIGN